MTKIQRAANRIREWRKNPRLFALECFGVTLDAWQEKTFAAFADPKQQRISMQACAGPGKTATLAMLGLNFLSCYGDRGDHPKGAAVSVTGDNLADNLWPEFSKWMSINEQSSYPFLSNEFTWTKTRIFANDHPETWFLSARSYSKTANADEQGRTLSGLHGKYVLALIDESGDIPVAVSKAADQALSTGPLFGKILQAGNPTSHYGMLYASATKFADLWSIIRITGDPDDPERSPRIDADWAREQIRTYGRNDPWVMAYILGIFPPSSINTLLGPDEVQAAMSRHLKEDDYKHAQKRLGIDVARFGDDRTIIFPRQGLASFSPVTMRNARSTDIAARVMAAKAKWGSEMELVDGTGGYGSGVVDSLLQAGQTPIEVHFSSKAIDNRYLNKRAEMWFLMAEWVKRGGVLPNDNELLKELTAPTYTFKDGKFQLEPKEQIKKRLSFSPDKADALALTFALPEMPSGHDQMASLRRGPTFLVDYDPFNQPEPKSDNGDQYKADYDPFKPI